MSKISYNIIINIIDKRFGDDDEVNNINININSTELIADDGALIGIVKSVSDDGSHTTITLKAPGLTAAIADGDEVCFRRPMTFRFGLEY